MKTVTLSDGDTVRVVSKPIQFTTDRGGFVPGFTATACRTRQGVRVGCAVATLALSEQGVIDTAVEFCSHGKRECGYCINP